MLPDAITLSATITDDQMAAIADMVAERLRDVIDSIGAAEMHRPMKPAEAARYLGIGESTLSALTNTDDDPIPAVYPLSDKSPRYRVVDLMPWLEARSARMRAA